MAAEAEGETAGLCQYFIDSSDEKAVQVFSNPLVRHNLRTFLVKFIQVTYGTIMLFRFGTFWGVTLIILT